MRAWGGGICDASHRLSVLFSLRAVGLLPAHKAGVPLPQVFFT